RSTPALYPLPLHDALPISGPSATSVASCPSAASASTSSSVYAHTPPALSVVTSTRIAPPLPLPAGPAPGFQVVYHVAPGPAARPRGAAPNLGVAARINLPPRVNGVRRRAPSPILRGSRPGGEGSTTRGAAGEAGGRMPSSRPGYDKAPAAPCRGFNASISHGSTPIGIPGSATSRSGSYGFGSQSGESDRSGPTASGSSSGSYGGSSAGAPGRGKGLSRFGPGTVAMPRLPSFRLALPDAAGTEKGAEDVPRTT